MWNLLAFIVPLALLDSLNPATVAVCIYLLGTPQPEKRAAAFIGGVVAAYFGGGLLLVLGLSQVIEYFYQVSEAIWRGLQAVAGIALIGFAWYLWSEKRKNDQPEYEKSISPLKSFLLGFAVTMSDLPTAIPYLAAIERTLQAGLSTAEAVAALGIYNFFYGLPLIALFVVRWMWGAENAEILEKINRFINRWSSPALAVISLLAGIALLADSVLFAFGKSFLGSVSNFMTP